MYSLSDFIRIPSAYMLRIFIKNVRSYKREAAADFSIAKLSAKFSLAKRSGKTQVSS